MLSEKIRDLADSAGIDALGFTEAYEFTGYAISHSRRIDPKLSLPSAKTIIVAGIYIGGITLPAWNNPSAQYSLNLQVLMQYPVGTCKEEYETLAC